MTRFTLLLVFCSGFLSVNGLSEKLESQVACRCTNGQCMQENGKEVCKCPSGFAKFTSTSCKACNCGPDSDCMWQGGWRGGKVCICQPGYSEKNGKCFDCECGPDSNCTWTSSLWSGDKKKCHCKPGYRDVKGKCVGNIIGSCTSNPCKNGGTCNDMENGYECSCTTEYTGKDCIDKYNGCNSNPCKNRGKCIDLGAHNFSCECVKPYSGQTCETKCICRGGNCVMEGGKSICKCPPGFGNITNASCKACDCGPDTNCIWEVGFVGRKVCLCKPGYSEKKGKCVDCECGPDSSCEWISEGWFRPEKKVCRCKPGYHEENGQCVDKPELRQLYNFP